MPAGDLIAGDDTPSDRAAAERRWSLAAAIASVAVFGLGIGQGGPLLSLMLERRGIDASLNGLNAGAAFIGVILGPLLTPRLVRRLGIRNLLLICFGCDMVAFTSLGLFSGLGAWFVLRVLLGLIGSTIFTTSEAWINLLAAGQGRGRIIGLYAAALSAGFGVGPFILALTGIDGWAPFVVNALLTVLAAVPLLVAGDRSRGLGREPGGSPLAMLRRAPFILAVVAAFGIYEIAMLTLLPVWGRRVGMSEGGAATTLSAVYFGSIVLQPLVGWLSDKTARPNVLVLCGATGLIGSVLMLAAPLPPPALLALLFISGGVAFGIYPVALGMAGDRFSDGDLVAANAGMIIAYGTGALVGPALGGVAMDLWNPQGLFGLFAAVFAALLAITLLARRQAAPG